MKKFKWSEDIENFCVESYYRKAGIEKLYYMDGLWYWAVGYEDVEKRVTAIVKIKWK